MSWRYLRSADHLTNLLVSNTSSTMKLFKSQTTNITIFFAASLVAAWNMPRLLAEGTEVIATQHDEVNSGSAAAATSKASTASSSSSSSTASSKSSSTTTTSPSKRDPNCPPYGCPLLPRDMYFDQEAQAALTTLRNLQQVISSQEQKEEEPSSSSSELNLIQALELLKTVGGEDQATLTLTGYKGGKLTEQINQDRAFVVSPFYIQSSQEDIYDITSSATRLLGVFDGHARLGEKVSEYTVQTLPQLLSSKLETILSNNFAATAAAANNNNNIAETSNNTKAQEEEIQNAIIDTFIEIDKTAPAHESGGCTATIVLQLNTKIYIANAGDSRSFIATYNKKTQRSNIVYITREDKPDLPEERVRVEQAGGSVYIPPPERVMMGASSRVVYVDKVTGSRNGLAMSRSIGDWAAGEMGVIATPTVNVVDIDELMKNAQTQECYNDEKKSDQTCYVDDESDVEVFAVSATDGLLDFMDVQEIANTVAMSLYVDEGPHPLSACESLITTAASAWWQAKNGQYRDDIAIAVSKLSL
mmetsp:Transcript_18042/g.22092  ORF Transcript_18042/g.22092 Transcript_18042/m.22092 type:complete len:531 (-) Transcript_18042:85-1677(-)